MSMYKGKKRFDRQQLNFIVEVMVCSAIDALEETLPKSVADQKHYNSSLTNVGIAYVLQSFSWNFSILYAQLTGDGMGTVDVPFLNKFEKQLRSLVEERFSPTWEGFKEGEKIHNINTGSLAGEMVTAVFGEYLND